MVEFVNNKTLVGFDNKKAMVDVNNEKTLVDVNNEKAVVEIYNSQTLVGFNIKDRINNKDTLVGSNKQKTLVLVEFRLLELEQRESRERTPDLVRRRQEAVDQEDRSQEDRSQDDGVSAPDSGCSGSLASLDDLLETQTDFRVSNKSERKLSQDFITIIKYKIVFSIFSKRLLYSYNVI